MSITIRDLQVLDVRFPTSRTQAGTDAMHPDPDYSAAYVILKTDGYLEGHGLTFTIGRGNEVCVAAIQAFRHLVVGQKLADITADLGGFWRRLAGESQLRWLGPEKGVIHISMAAIVNAVWDLYAKWAGKPLWKLLADLSPREIVSCIDFRYITDALTPEGAVAILERMAAKFGVPVCPHAGGVGLCEYVQHLSMFDYIAVSASLESRVIEYVDHLHEHFVEPVVIRNARYMPPLKPGYSITIRPESREAYRYPQGSVWAGEAPTAAGEWHEATHERHEP